jgi:hypothetical protein
MEQLMILSWQIAGIAAAVAFTAFVIAIPVMFIIMWLDDSARDV